MIRCRLFNYNTNIIGLTCVGVDIVFLRTIEWLRNVFVYFWISRQRIERGLQS